MSLNQDDIQHFLEEENRENGVGTPAYDPECFEKIAYHFTEIMNALNLDLEDDNLKDTPRRVAKMYQEVFASLKEGQEPKITVFDNEENYNSMVTVKDIPFYSMCAHHFLPFFGVAHVAYMPTDKIVGISKLARIVKFYARLPQIQERMTQQVADYIDEKLKPRGVYVVVEGRHMCMEMRGIESHDSKTVTSALRGSFAKPETRQEFLSLLHNSRWDGR